MLKGNLNKANSKKHFPICNCGKHKISLNVIFITFVTLLIFLSLFSLTLGRYEITYQQVINVFIEKITGNNLVQDKFIEKIIFQVRLPRIIAAILIGGSLAISGASFQGMFRNPMVSPDILGVTSGAGFGAALGILMKLSMLGIQLLSFFFGLLAVTITYLISKAVGKGSGELILLILSGMVIGTLFKSFISCATYVADPDDTLPTITYWLMGSLSNVSLKKVIILIIPIVLGIIPLMLARWKLNALAFGEEDAMAMGINTDLLKIVIIISSTVITSISISMCGIVGWVGLIVPHLARMIVGPNNKALIPTSLILGSIYLLAVDDICRSVATVELPLGILTSIIGAPFFIYLLFKTRRVW